MGGTSTSQQTQNSTTNPWTPAQPLLQGILGQTQSGLNNTGITGTETNALNTLQQNGQNYTSQFAPQIGNYANDLLAGGGATNQAGNINQAYQTYQNQVNPLASNTNYDPMQTPGIGDQLNALRDSITTQVNGSFAGAGRDGSGYNQKALGSGLTAGLAPILTNQYNTNVAAQQGAANNLYNAGNTNAGLLAGLQQQALANRGQGVAASSAFNDAQNAGANAQLQAEAARRGIPVQALGLLAQIGIPIAGLGGQSTGQSNGSQTMSGAQQFGQIAGGIGGLFGGAGNLFTGLGKFSDRRLKQDITQVGTLFDGTPVYRYRYIGQPIFEIGLMAQDIEKATPEAVGQIGAYKTVNYKLATDKAVEAA